MAITEGTLTLKHIIGIGGGWMPVCQACHDASIESGETTADEWGGSGWSAAVCGACGKP